MEGNDQLVKYLNADPNLPHLKVIVMYGESINSTENKATALHPSLSNVTIYDFETFLRLGTELPDSQLDERRTDPEHCVTLIYTSGTTGIF